LGSFAGGFCHASGTFSGHLSYHAHNLAPLKKGIGNMHSHIRSGFILAAAAAALMSSAALAQTAQPNAGAASTTTATTTTVSTANWLTQETAGQWRTSKMIGLNVYNSVSDKIGAISELVVDRSGKIEAVVVGAGGFLGLGEHDVAVPYDQISWSSQPVGSSGIGTAPTTTGAATSQKSENPRSYPDHAVLNMSKDQLKAAPAFKFSR
jgi:sporulation protein YlmC with PRC-barrel domain